MEDAERVEAMTASERARLQIAIGEAAHAGRQGSSRNDWVDAAHYQLLGRVPAQIRRLYRRRGVRWHDLARVTKTIQQEAPLASS